MSIFFVSKYGVSDLNGMQFVIPSKCIYPFCIFAFVSIISEQWTVNATPFVPKVDFVRGIERIACLPGQVCLKWLFPRKDIIVLALVLSIHQKVSMTEDEITS